MCPLPSAEGLAESVLPFCTLAYRPVLQYLCVMVEC